MTKTTRLEKTLSQGVNGKERLAEYDVYVGDQVVGRLRSRKGRWLGARASHVFRSVDGVEEPTVGVRGLFRRNLDDVALEAYRRLNRGPGH